MIIKEWVKISSHKQRRKENLRYAHLRRQKHRVAVNLKPAPLTQGVPDHLGLEGEKGSEKGEYSNPQKFNT